MDERIMEELRPVSPFLNYRGCLLPLLILGVAFYLVVQSANYQVPDDPACYGHLRAGWPVAFLCDDSAGSPTSSWGVIDEADWSFPLYLFSPPFLLNILFYAALLSIPWFIVRGIAHLVRQRRQAPS